MLHGIGNMFSEYEVKILRPREIFIRKQYSCLVFSVPFSVGKYALHSRLCPCFITVHCIKLEGFCATAVNNTAPFSGNITVQRVFSVPAVNKQFSYPSAVWFMKYFKGSGIFSASHKHIMSMYLHICVIFFVFVLGITNKLSQIFAYRQVIPLGVLKIITTAVVCCAMPYALCKQSKKHSFERLRVLTSGF
jgi:hypothetical protein